MSPPLAMSDDLSYLDAVKVQLHDKPKVYDQFLDITKVSKGHV